jgi:hypothetical protein
MLSAMQGILARRSLLDEFAADNRSSFFRVLAPAHPACPV